ncbi:DUF948 domain-containing protein [Bifidobacterium aquikefiri]|uniref:DUF948 domain-containing protein n=1 Tax=Bifidobacterium aquikefiri TaxID=1653207 RepID=A0A261G6A6_9BIFI|nr:DUF948 domain-containing protein [Bifidobacterium aquikefiri]OZG66950.1 hypothetical protein BAQU_1022 [Bifidobacterium aquikefiri]
MGVGEIAGLIAAIAFAVLAGFLIYPLIRLGRLLDQISDTVKQAGDHVMPTIDETTTTVKQVNDTLADVNKISSAASTTVNNVGALTDLYTSMLGKPIIKVAAAFYAAKTTATSFMSRKKHSKSSATQPTFATSDLAADTPAAATHVTEE